MLCMNGLVLVESLLKKMGLCVSCMHIKPRRLLAPTMFKKGTIKNVSFVIVNRTKMSIIYRGFVVCYFVFFSLFPES